MSEINNGGPAFPMACVTVLAQDGTPNEAAALTHNGMTLRDYFAAKALAGYMATSHPADGLKYVSMEENDRDIARHCYAIADAMLKAREAA